MNLLINIMTKLGLLKKDLDYHLLRASMVIIFLFFGYQKWFDYEAQALVPYISHGPLIFWMYPVFGIKGVCLFLGVAEWLFGGPVARWLLEQEVGNPWSYWRIWFFHSDLHDHSLHSRRLGSICRRVSGDD